LPLGVVEVWQAVVSTVLWRSKNKLTESTTHRQGQ
jgi:hypothetical protein